MFSLIRRFSGSVIPRPDRPWAEDPTSNAPRVGAKRRMADEDRDEDDDEQARLKKVRSAANEAQLDTRESSSTPLPPATESAGVKEVTKGVKEVELDEKPHAAALPESVPLPAEKAGELDADASSTASTPPPAGEPSEVEPTDIVADAPETASAEAISDPAEADTGDAQPPADALDASDAAAEPRPIKKLRAAKPKSAGQQPAVPTESAETAAPTESVESVES